jgi:hypothetical protein
LSMGPPWAWALNQVSIAWNSAWPISSHRPRWMNERMNTIVCTNDRQASLLTKAHRNENQKIKNWGIEMRQWHENPQIPVLQWTVDEQAIVQGIDLWRV